MRANMLLLPALLLLSLSVPARADSNLLLLAQQRSEAAGRDAKARQADLEAKANADLARAKQKALDMAEETARKLKANEQNLEQDLIDGKAAVVSAISCELKNRLNGAVEKMTMQLDGTKIVDHVMLPLKQLFPNDSIRNNEAISFVSSLQDGSHVQLELIDLTDSNKILRTGSLADLDLSALDANCNPTHEIVYLNGGGGHVQINTQTTTPKDAVQQVGGAVVADVKTIIETAKSAQ